MLYFSSTDLMIEVSYKKEANALNYYSHRSLSFGERVIVEQYLLTNVAVKTEYYKKHPALFSYLGIDNKLGKNLNEFHLKNTIKTLKEKDVEAEKAVKHLIDQSLTNYYMEQIGNTIMEIREAIEDPIYEANVDIYKTKLRNLVRAYNVYSTNKIKYNDVIPKELKRFL